MRMQHNDLIHQSNFVLSDYFGERPIVGGILSILLCSLGFINIDAKAIADSVNPYFMLLRDVGIGLGVIISMITLYGLIKKNKNGNAG